MAHTHDHAHDPGSYYAEQICTIGICGALGGVAVMLYKQDLLKLMLHPTFHPFVLAGGLTLLALVAVRAVVVWHETGKRAAHDHDHHRDHDHDHHRDHDHDHHRDHDHDHHHDHDHDHAHGHSHGHGHDHSHGHSHAEDHGHDHAFSPWRYVVLLLPVVLFFLKLPNDGFTAQPSMIDINVGEVGAVENKDGKTFDVGFLELERASQTSEMRAYYEGSTVRIVGQHVPNPNERTFGLVRYKMNCCAADAIPLSALIMLDPKAEQTIDHSKYRGKWVRVTGQVRFRPRPDQPGNYVTVVLLRPTEEQPLTDLVREIPKPAEVFLF